jgi:AcrR family transcriptional regulator
MPNRAPRLREGVERPTTRGSLTRSAVVSAAIALADGDGLGSVSIRKVAANLGVRPMSLYTYIASKDDLLRLMADEVVAEVVVPGALPSGWREALTLIAHRSHQTFLAHPWLLGIAGHRPHLGQSAVRHAEQLLAAVAELEVEPEEAWQILYTVNDYTLGHALRITHADTDSADNFPAFETADFPTLARAVRRPVNQRSESTFKAGLDLLLDGIGLRYRSKAHPS